MRIVLIRGAGYRSQVNSLFGIQASSRLVLQFRAHRRTPKCSLPSRDARNIIPPIFSPMYFSQHTYMHYNTMR